MVRFEGGFGWAITMSPASAEGSFERRRVNAALGVAP